MTARTMMRGTPNPTATPIAVLVEASVPDGATFELAAADVVVVAAALGGSEVTDVAVDVADVLEPTDEVVATAEESVVVDDGMRSSGKMLK